MNDCGNQRDPGIQENAKESEEYGKKCSTAHTYGFVAGRTIYFINKYSHFIFLASSSVAVYSYVVAFMYKFGYYSSLHIDISLIRIELDEFMVSYIVLMFYIPCLFYYLIAKFFNDIKKDIHVSKLVLFMLRVVMYVFFIVVPILIIKYIFVMDLSILILVFFATTIVIEAAVGFWEGLFQSKLLRKVSYIISVSIILLLATLYSPFIVGKEMSKIERYYMYIKEYGCVVVDISGDKIICKKINDNRTSDYVILNTSSLDCIGYDMLKIKLR